MADTNISHKDVGQQLSKTEWEAADTHVVSHSIADNAVVTVDDTDAADNDIAKFTASGLEGRSCAELLGDLSGEATAAFSMNSQKVTSVADPTEAQDAATKNYVDTMIGKKE